MKSLKLVLSAILVFSLVCLTMAKPWGSNERCDNRRRYGDRDRYDGRNRDRYDGRNRDRYDGRDRDRYERDDHSNEHHHSHESDSHEYERNKSILDVISDFIGK